MTVHRQAQAAIPVLAVLVMIGCRSGHSDGWSSRARRMILTSGHSEIVMSSSRVPGYWARLVDGEDSFFIYTRDRSFETGNRVDVEGPFGPASPSVFRDGTGEYVRTTWDPVFVLVVWKIRRVENAPRP